MADKVNPSSNTSAQNDLLLPEKVRRRLDPLMLVARKIRAGAMKGERRSIKRGTSIEFADYRNYTPGDDLRKLDWNVYARLQKPYIKLLEDEEDLAVHLLLDISASMDWPNAESDIADAQAIKDANKLLFAQRLFASLAYLSLTNSDRLMMSAIGETGIQQFGPSRGRGQVVPMLRFVRGLEAKGRTDLNQALRAYALRERRPGLLFLITDMFSPNGYTDGLNMLLGKGHEVVLLHVLSPDEVIPPLAGDLRLVDMETGTAQEVTIDATMRTFYAQRLDAWLNEIRTDCGRKGVHYVMAQTDSVWEKILLFDLRRLGLVK